MANDSGSDEFERGGGGVRQQKGGKGFNTGGAAQGAAGGAIAGAPLGPLGVAGGAIFGGLFGGLSGNKKNKGPLYDPNAVGIDPGAFEFGSAGFIDEFDARADAAQERLAPDDIEAAAAEYARINQDPQEQFRSSQEQLVSDLQSRARGETASAAELQLRQGQSQAMRTALALSRSQPGLSPGAAQRSAQMAGIELQGQANQEAAILRAQEQAAAEGRLAGVLGGARGQDIGMATSQAGFEQQANLSNAQMEQQANMFNTQTEMQQRQFNDSMTQYYMSQGMSREQAQQQANMAYEQMIQQQTQWEQSLEAQIAMAEAGNKKDKAIAQQQMMSNIVGSGMQAAGQAGSAAAAAYSDINLKENIGDGDPAVGAILNSMGQSGAPAVMPMQQQQQAPTYGPAVDIRNAIRGMPASIQGAGRSISAAISDEDAKKNKKSGGSEIEEFLGVLEPYEYEYRDPESLGVAPGKKIGIMAQDLEQSELGARAVIETPEGKAIDMREATSIALAALGHLNKKIDKMNKGKK